MYSLPLHNFIKLVNGFVNRSQPQVRMRKPLTSNSASKLESQQHRGLHPPWTFCFWSKTLKANLHGQKKGPSTISIHFHRFWAINWHQFFISFFPVSALALCLNVWIGSHYCNDFCLSILGLPCVSSPQLLSFTKINTRPAASCLLHRHTSLRPSFLVSALTLAWQWQPHSEYENTTHGRSNDNSL